MKDRKSSKSGHRCVLVIIALGGLLFPPRAEVNVNAPRQASAKWKMNKAAAITPSVTRTEKISPKDLSALSVITAAGKSEAANWLATAKQGNTEYLVLNVEFVSPLARKRFSVRNAHVFTGYAQFADIFIALGPETEQVLKAVILAPGVRRIDPAERVIAPPPPVVETQRERGRERAERIVRGGIMNLTGKGAIIAIVDTGVDFRNPDFISYDAKGQPTSRLLYLWDTFSPDYDTKRIGSKPPLAFPNGASVGTIYTRDQLTAELRSSTPNLAPTDLNGHGTACAGVAAGNGNNGPGRDEVKGVAPDADLIAVRIGGTRHSDGSVGGGIENAYLLGAICGWLDKVAGSQPLVVSCSFGGHCGGHDGALVVERQLNARFGVGKKGRALVFSAGNEGQKLMHAEARFRGSNRPGLISWVAEDTAMIDLYFNTSLLDDIRVIPAEGVTLGAHGGEINPLTNKGMYYVVVPQGRGALFLINNSGKAFLAEAYIRGGSFEDGVTYNHIIGTPGTTRQAITVGSYDWNEAFDLEGQIVAVTGVCGAADPLKIGELSCYSSPGFSRDGTVKPDVTAPGQIFHASYAKPLVSQGVSEGEQTGTIVDTSGNYMLFNGTSAAAPYVSGVIALLFQKNPMLTTGQIKLLFRQYATRDAFTGEVPNNRWGYGKLDLAAVKRMISAAKRRRT